MLVEAALAIMAMGEGGDLIHKSITENGNYDPADEDPPVDGYDYVSVSVETYEDELEQALADLAAAQAQIADYQACQAAVISKLQEYDPDFDPQTCEDIVDKVEEDEGKKEEAEEALEEVAEEVDADPEDPTYPDNVLPAVKAAEGFEFPVGTEYDPDIISIVGDASVEDVTLGITLVWKYTSYDSYGPNAIEWGYIQGGEYHYITSTSNTDPTAIYTNKYIKVTDPTTGKMEIAWDYTYAGSTYTWHQKTYPTVSAIIGFGASGHEFKAKNV